MNIPSSTPDLRHAVNHIVNVMQNLAAVPAPTEQPEVDGYIRRAREAIRGCVRCTGIVGGQVNAEDGRAIKRQIVDGFNADERDQILEARRVLRQEGLDVDACRLFTNLYQMAGYLGVGTLIAAAPERRLHQTIHALARGAVCPKEPQT